MGIQNLLPLLEKSTRQCHVSEFRGLTVAVDSYCWLHKGARSCALQLAKGEDTDIYVTYCMKYVTMLLSYDIKPIMVFDGCHLPAKMKTEEKRRDSKKQARKQGVELLRLGRVNDAWKFFKQCIDITPEMALRLIKECRKINIDCIVAPYEADAQLAFFSLKGVADCIISEDSDLLLFGCKKVLYKMDLNGVGQLVEANKLHESMKIRPNQYTLDKFRYMCILSGCDYIDSLPGIGLKKALKFISMTAEDNPEIFLDKLPRYLNMRHLSVDNEYKENFMTADATFKYQIVYDPFQRKLLPLNPINTKIEYCKNSGKMLDPEEAFQLALGNINPMTMKKIDNWQPSSCVLTSHSIWSNNYTPRQLKCKNTFDSKPKSMELKVIDKEKIELDNRLHDLQMKKELEFYKKVPTESETCSEIEHESETESSISPVLQTNSKNPFLKKKISKFNLTSPTQNQKIVKSKFFASSNSEISKEDISQNKTELDQLKDALPTPDENMDIEASTFLNEASKLSKSTSVKTSNENLCGDFLLTPEMDTDISNLSQESKSENSNKSDEDEPMVECECILEVSESEVDIPVEVPTLSSVENIVQKSTAKKRKFKSELADQTKQKKQITIQDMFKKMRSK